LEISRRRRRDVLVRVSSEDVAIAVERDYNCKEIEKLINEV